MGKRGRRKAKAGGADAAPAAVSEYRDGEGNVLTLRDELTELAKRLSS